MYFNHQLGFQTPFLNERALREAFRSLYTFVDAKDQDHFVFTSSGAEAVNHAVFSTYLDVTRKTGKNHFLCLNTDEAAAIMALSRLQELGCVFQMVPVNKAGVVTKQAVAEMITPRTAFLSMSVVNGLTGVIQPVAEIADLCKERGIVFHVDATHVLGKIPFTFEESGADVLTFDGYKPCGGGLFFRDGFEMSPFILGGNEQAQMRGGAFSPNQLIEMAEEAKQSLEYRDHVCLEIARLKMHFEALLCESIEGAEVLFEKSERVPHITSLQFPGVTSDALCYLLQQKGVYATFGGNHFQHILHILKASGIEEPMCHSALSFAFSHTTTEQQIEQGAQIIIETAKGLQKCSQFLMEQVG